MRASSRLVRDSNGLSDIGDHSPVGRVATLWSLRDWVRPAGNSTDRDAQTAERETMGDRP